MVRTVTFRDLYISFTSRRSEQVAFSHSSLRQRKLSISSGVHTQTHGEEQSHTEIESRAGPGHCPALVSLPQRGLNKGCHSFMTGQKGQCSDALDFQHCSQRVSINANL